MCSALSGGLPWEISSCEMLHPEELEASVHTERISLLAGLSHYSVLIESGLKAAVCLVVGAWVISPVCEWVCVFVRVFFLRNPYRNITLIEIWGCEENLSVVYNHLNHLKLVKSCGNDDFIYLAYTVATEHSQIFFKISFNRRFYIWSFCIPVTTDCEVISFFSFIQIRAWSC